MNKERAPEFAVLSRLSRISPPPSRTIFSLRFRTCTILRKKPSIICRSLCRIPTAAPPCKMPWMNFSPLLISVPKPPMPLIPSWILCRPLQNDFPIPHQVVYRAVHLVRNTPSAQNPWVVDSVLPPHHSVGFRIAAALPVPVGSSRLPCATLV